MVAPMMGPRMDIAAMLGSMVGGRWIAGMTMHFRHQQGQGSTGLWLVLTDPASLHVGHPGSSNPRDVHCLYFSEAERVAELEYRRRFAGAGAASDCVAFGSLRLAWSDGVSTVSERAWRSP
jgi:hypothetical protein